MCGFIGAQAQIDTKQSGGKNPLVELAQGIDIFAAPDELRGEVVAQDWREDPRLAPQGADPDTGQEASNSHGSYEAFLSSFGRMPVTTPPGEDAA